MHDRHRSLPVLAATTGTHILERYACSVYSPKRWTTLSEGLGGVSGRVEATIGDPRRRAPSASKRERTRGRGADGPKRRTLPSSAAWHSLTDVRLSPCPATADHCRLLHEVPTPLEVILCSSATCRN